MDDDFTPLFMFESKHSSVEVYKNPNGSVDIVQIGGDAKSISTQVPKDELHKLLDALRKIIENHDENCH